MYGHTLSGFRPVRMLIWQFTQAVSYNHFFLNATFTDLNERHLKHSFIYGLVYAMQEMIMNVYPHQYEIVYLIHVDYLT